jgi:hypothetical protein
MAIIAIPESLTSTSGVAGSRRETGFGCPPELILLTVSSSAPCMLCTQKFTTPITKGVRWQHHYDG